MATTAQISITVDESGVVTGVNKIGQSVSALDLKMQEMGARADSIWGNLAKAPKEVQQQFAFLSSESAKLGSNFGIVNEELTLLSANMDRASSAGASLAATQNDVSSATTRAGGSYIMASSGLSMLEGRTLSANRAAAQFLNNTLGLGSALQGAFQVFGAAALAEVLFNVGKAAYDLYQNVVNLKKANEDLDKIDLRVANDSRQMEDAIERQRVKFIELTQGVIAAREEEERFFTHKPVDLSAFFNADDFRKLSDSVKQQTQQMFQFFDPSQFPQKIQFAKDKIDDLKKQIANPVIDNSGFLPIVITDEPLLKAQERLYEDILKELTDKQKLFTVTAMTDAAAVGKAEEDAADKTQKAWEKALNAGDKMLAKLQEGFEKQVDKENALDEQTNKLLQDFANKDLQRNQKMVDDFDKAQAKMGKVLGETATKYNELQDAAAVAAEASATKWLSATGRIELQAQKQADAWQKEADQTQIGQQIAAQGTADIWTAAAAKIEQEQQQLGTKLGNEFEQFFNDLTSGNIGKTILQGFERFFFNILGQWAATVKGMQNVTTNGSGNLVQGLLQSAFSFLSPPPVTGAQAQAQAAATFGGPNEAATLQGLGGTGAGINSSLDIFAGSPLAGLDILGAGSLSTAATGSSAPSAAVPSSPSVGGASAVKQGLTGALSISGLQKLAPLALLMAAASGKVGGKAGSLGLGLAGLGAMFELNPSMFGGALSFFNISNPLMASGFGALTGGLVGFGLGSQFGPTIGALGGAAAGAGSVALAALLAGTAAFPVVGTIIGGIVGALAGLFGGLFGGGPSKHTLADRYIQANVLPAIQQDLASYEGFSSDFSSTIADLEKIKSDSHTQMKQQFGSDATNDEWNKLVVPAVAGAETQIRNDEAERNRRSSLMFGAPQFADGGQFFTSSSSGGPAWLHNGETVMTSAATRMFGPNTLLAMNEFARGGGSGSIGGVTHVTHNHYYTINAVDAPSFMNMLRSHGMKSIAQLSRQYSLEGR